VIADDAEEVKSPDRNVPLGILISLTLCTILYPLIALVTLGTISWSELAGSDVALTDAFARFLPGSGPLILGVGGILATLTTLNSSMLSATREAFTLSRDGMWPRVFSRLSHFRTPYIATLVIGGIICCIAAIGLVEFLSYISSSGYLFVLFWSNLALIRLRKRYPNLQRPFRVPFFPITAYMAVGTCFLILIFTELRALGFGVGLIAGLSCFYYAAPVVNRVYSEHTQKVEKLLNRILVPVANPKMGARLVYFATILAQAIEDTSICVFHLAHAPHESSAPSKLRNGRRDAASQAFSLPDQIMREVHRRNVPLYTKTRHGSSIGRGILDEVQSNHNVKLILAGWPGPISPNGGTENPIQILLEKAPTNIAVFLSHQSRQIRNILVPIGGGPHSRLALRLAYEIAEQENARITAFHTFPNTAETEEVEDQMISLHQVVNEELGEMPARLTTRVARAESVITGILDEMRRQSYDLLVMGASEEYGSRTRLFGSVDDWIIEHVENCSVLLVRQHERAVIHWFRRRLKRIIGEY
jgi:nucleotide-binding universal stress UspA family protein